MGEREEIEELLFGYQDSKEGLSDFDIHVGGIGSEGMLGLVDGAVKDRSTSEMPVNLARATGCRPAGYTAQVLDEAGVPNILWGYWAASVMGDCMPQSSIDFVIPDAFMNLAIAILTSAGYSLCVKQDCFWNKVLCEHPPATVHFDKVKDSRLWGPLRLYTKSSVLWWLPDPTPSLPTLDDAYYMLTNDQRLPQRTWPHSGPDGPWLDIYPVRIVKPVLFTEALILLCCRDHNHVNNFEPYWRKLLGAMNEENPDPNTYLRKRLRPKFQKCWNVAKYGGKYRIDAQVQQLREELIESLPATPYYYGFLTKERAILQGSRFS